MWSTRIVVLSVVWCYLYPKQEQKRRGERQTCPTRSSPWPTRSAATPSTLPPTSQRRETRSSSSLMPADLVLGLTPQRLGSTNHLYINVLRIPTVVTRLEVCSTGRHHSTVLYDTLVL